MMEAAAQAVKRVSEAGYCSFTGAGVTVLTSLSRPGKQ